MTKEEKLAACRSQFLYKQFYDANKVYLDRLHANELFMSRIHDVSENTAEALLFGSYTTTERSDVMKFRSFKDSFCNIFFETLRFDVFPDYKEVYYKVKNSGYSGKSATISVFYAMVYLDVLYEKEICDDKKAGFFRKLFGANKEPK